MRFTITASVVTLLSIASVIKAQDANCSAVLNNYNPTSSGLYQKCYTNQIYNAELVAQGASPNYTQIINDVCGKSACSHSTLTTATSNYITACGPSMATEVTNSAGEVLTLGKNALDIFFAEPIRDAYCAVDPSAPVVAPPAIAAPVYCLATPPVNNPSNRFVSSLAVYLTSGTIRASQAPFFSAGGNIFTSDTCSACSQIAFNSTIQYLSNNLMPNISVFYTPEFVQYWTSIVPAYNQLCNTSFVQTWPNGTLNVVPSNVPTGNPASPTTALATATQTTAATPTATHNAAAGLLKPVATIATAIFLASVALF
jgi:hypothetical protein